MTLPPLYLLACVSFPDLARFPPQPVAALATAINQDCQTYLDYRAAQSPRDYEVIHLLQAQCREIGLIWNTLLEAQNTFNSPDYRLQVLTDLHKRLGDEAWLQGRMPLAIPPNLCWGE